MRRVVAGSLVGLMVAGGPLGAQMAAAPGTTEQTGAAAKTASAPGVATVAALPGTLMDGTAVKLRLGEAISSAHATTGEPVPLTVAEDVVVEGVTVIAKGTPAQGTVTVAEPKRRMGRGGRLDVRVDSTRMMDGALVPLRAVKDNRGGGHMGVMTGAMVATGVLFFPAAPLFLLVKGKDAKVPEGTEVMAYVQGDLPLERPKAARGGTASETGTGAGAGEAGPAAMASLTVDASVSGADIEVDGRFVGSTPSTVSVTPGEHVIAVKKKGYADWSRTMGVAGSGVRVMAEMEKAGS